MVEVTGESFFPGGAANVARNLREFVDRVSIIGLIGKDRSGQQLRELLAETKIDMSNSVEDEKFRTIVKTRIVARHQQVVRVDRETITGPSKAQIGKVVAAVRKKLPETDAIITRLASLQNLAVRPTSAVLKYAKEPADPGKAAEELGVDSVLDGTYQRVAGVMRVSVQLVDRDNRAMRWAEHYDLRADDMLKFQDEVAQKVVEGLRVQVSGQEQESQLRRPLPGRPVPGPQSQGLRWR